MAFVSRRMLAVIAALAASGASGAFATALPAAAEAPPTGRAYQRASDPVVAYGPGGTAYLSVLLINASNCDTAVAVLRSFDGGQRWGAVSYVHRSATCDYSDDKNWIVVDNSRSSSHYGRVYQFWTPFLAKGDTYIGSPQAVRWSDNYGKTWSTTRYVTARDHGTQNSQPMIERDGTIVDTYYDYGQGERAPDVAPGLAPESRGARLRVRAAEPAIIDATGPVFASTSRNGGKTGGTPVEIVTNAGGYADGVRCCLFAADIDHRTGRMFIAYEGGVGNTDPV